MSARQRIEENPFYVLGLPTDCTAHEIEREGSRWLGMLTLGLREAQSYLTPLGSRPRTAEGVRQAMAELRDPERRLAWELWARLPLAASVPSPAASAPPTPGFAEALQVLGFASRR